MIIEDLRDKDSFEKIEILEELEISNDISNSKFEILDYLSNDEDYEVRAKVAEVLVQTNDAKTENILIKLLRDKDELVRVNACDSLSNTNSYEVIYYLKDRILKDNSSLVKGYAILSLVDIVIKLNYDFLEIKVFLENILKIQKVKWVKIHIYKALYMLGDKKYLDSIIVELNNRYYRNRCSVVNILKELISTNNYDKINNALIERMKKENCVSVKSSIEEIVGN